MATAHIPLSGVLLPSVTVVVPTCGRPALLQRCLDALARQTLDPCRMEVIVVDDSRARRGPAAARNDGWRKARAPIVAFTDDDTEPAPDWLEKGLAALGEEVDAVSGRIALPAQEARLDRERGEFPAANCFCRKDLLEEIGGFDEEFRLPGREGPDLEFRLMQAGARILHEPRAIVVRPPRPAPWVASLRRQRKVMFDALLYKKHRKLYRERIVPGARWEYHAIVAALAASLVSAALGAHALAFLLAVVWLGFTATLCIHRLRGTSRAPLSVLEVLATAVALPPLTVFWRLVGALRFRVAFV
ncbi:MAG TPA: glycosyltransferase [Burkholderiales bacterium]